MAASDSVPSAGSREETWTVGRLLEWTTQYFRDQGIENPRLDAEILLAETLASRRIDLYVHYHEEVGPGDRARYRDQVRQRASGCPVAYVVGYKEFFSLRFEVSPAVLIPRPETEHLVEAAIEFAHQNPVRRFLDVGTGSGAIAVAVAKQLADAVGVATDMSAAALALARRNAATHGVADRLEFIESDVFGQLAQQPTFDLILANPPYIPESEYLTLDRTVRDYEPRAALCGGPDGLTVIRRLVAEAPRHLRPGGLFALEIGAGQENAVHALLAPPWQLLPSIRDFGGHARIVRAVLKEE